jgi:hypothetical protein
MAYTIKAKGIKFTIPLHKTHWDAVTIFKYKHSAMYFVYSPTEPIRMLF